MNRLVGAVALICLVVGFVVGRAWPGSEARGQAVSAQDNSGGQFVTTASPDGKTLHFWSIRGWEYSRSAKISSPIIDYCGSATMPANVALDVNTVQHQMPRPPQNLPRRR